MKTECITEKLIAAVNKASRCVAKSSEVKTLEAIHIVAADESLTLRATNLEIGVEITIPAKVIEPGEVLVPTNVFVQFLASTQQKKTITLSLDGANLKVSAPGMQTVIKVISGDELPTVPRFEPEYTAILPAAQFLKGLRSVWWSAATTGIKPELSSVYVTTDGNSMVFAATDSFRLAERRVTMESAFDFGYILIPQKNVVEMAKLIDGLDKIDVSIAKNNISISSEGFYFVSRLVEGVFPNYHAIIPKAPVTTLVILRQDLVDALKMSTIFSDRFYQLQLTVTKDTVQIQTKSSDSGESVVDIPATIEGEPIEIRFNYRYISECLANITTDSVVCELSGPGKPMVLRPVGDTQFLYLVMPMNR